MGELAWQIYAIKVAKMVLRTVCVLSRKRQLKRNI